MKYSLTLIISLLAAFITSAQNKEIDLPPNPQSGHCYVRCQVNGSFQKWRDVDCALVQFQKLEVLSRDELSKKDKKELSKVFKKFIKEGYKLQLDSYYTSSASIPDNVIESRERAITVANYLVSLGYSPELLKVNALGSTQKKTGFWYRVINTN